MNKALIITEDISEPIDEGIKKFSFYLAKYIADFSEENMIFSASTNAALKHIHPLPKNKLLFSLRFFRKIYQSKARLLLYVPFSSSTTMGFIRLYLISLFARDAKNVMVSVQERKHGRFSKKIISFCKPDILVVLSNKQADYYRKLGFTCLVSPIGVESEKYAEVTTTEKIELRHKLNLPIQDKIVLHVGHLNKGRNLEVLKPLLNKGYKIVIVTSTRFESDLKLKTELEELGYLFITDYIKNIEQYYQASDIYIFPVLSAVSAMEFPMSVLESMSCNIPVITTRFGGIESFLTETDWFKYFSNKDELMAKIETLPLQGQCENRKLVLSKFAWANVFNNLFAKEELQ